MKLASVALRILPLAASAVVGCANGGFFDVDPHGGSENGGNGSGQDGVDGSSATNANGTSNGGTSSGGTLDGGGGGPSDGSVGADGASSVDAADAGSFTFVTQTIQDSASSGTPDSYFYNVHAGDPITANVTGGGSGAWSINASNGTSAGVYCSGAPSCTFTVPVGVPTIIITVVTTDIGFYTLTIKRPQH